MGARTKRARRRIEQLERELAAANARASDAAKIAMDRMRDNGELRGRVDRYWDRATAYRAALNKLSPAAASMIEDHFGDMPVRG